MAADTSRKALNSQLWPPPAWTTISSTSPERLTPPRMSSPVRAWLIESVASFIRWFSRRFPIAEPQRRGRVPRVHHHHRQPAVYREPGRRLGPEPPQHRRWRAHAQVLHHAHDLVGAKDRAAGRDAVAGAPRGQSVHVGVGDAPEAARPPQQQEAAGARNAQASFPRASRLSTRITSPPIGASPCRKPPSPATIEPAGTCTTSRAASADRPITS